MRYAARVPLGSRTAARTAADVAPAEPAQRVPQHRLVAGDDRAVETPLQLLDDPEGGDVSTTDEIGVGLRASGLDGTVSPELRRLCAKCIAAAEIVADCIQHVVAGTAQKSDL